jgi:hypothetical protein
MRQNILQQRNCRLMIVLVVVILGLFLAALSLIMLR